MTTGVYYCEACGRLEVDCICKIQWTPQSLVPPLGWRCPCCGRGLAPDVKECSCKNDVLRNYAANRKFDEFFWPRWISRTTPPEA